MKPCNILCPLHLCFSSLFFGKHLSNVNGNRTPISNNKHSDDIIVFLMFPFASHFSQCIYTYSPMLGVFFSLFVTFTLHLWSWLNLKSMCVISVANLNKHIFIHTQHPRCVHANRPSTLAQRARLAIQAFIASKMLWLDFMLVLIASRTSLGIFVYVFGFENDRLRLWTKFKYVNCNLQNCIFLKWF